jgi:hypothetical protein
MSDASDKRQSGGPSGPSPRSWVNEVVAECPICGRPVRRSDPRDLALVTDPARLGDVALCHLACTGREIPPDPPPEGYEEAKRAEERKLEALRTAVAARLGKGGSS